MGFILYKKGKQAFEGGGVLYCIRTILSHPQKSPVTFLYKNGYKALGIWLLDQDSNLGPID